MKLFLLCLFFGLLAFHSRYFEIDAEEQFNFPQLSFNYDTTGFLRTPIDYQFCAAVPNPPSMTLKYPKDYLNATGSVTDKEPCDQTKFVGHVIVSVLGSLVFVILILCITCCCCPGICFLRYKFEYFGGGKPSSVNGVRGIILPGNSVEGLKYGYPRTEVATIRIGYLVTFFVIMFGAGIVIVSTQMISDFAYNTNQIFVDYTDYTTNTVQYVGSQILSIDGNATSSSTLAIVLNSYKTANDFNNERSSELSDRLIGLQRSVEALFYITVSLVFVCLLLGIISGWLHLPKLTIGLSLFLMLVLALVWFDFTVTYGASNIFNKMCDTINNCHFCYMGQVAGLPDCNQCNEPWFQTMSECSNNDMNRFQNITNLMSTYVGRAAVDTCSAVEAFCSSNNPAVQCVYVQSTGCSPENIIMSSSLPVYATINSVVYPISYFNSTQALNVVAAYGVVSTYQALLYRLTSLNCGADNAFVESTPGPGLGWHGTFDKLQEQLCPAMTSPEYSIFDMLELTAVGLIIMGLFIPFAQVFLCLGEKRWVRRAYLAEAFREDGATSYLINETPLGLNKIF